MDGLFSDPPTAETIVSDLGRSAFIRQKAAVELMDVDSPPVQIRRQLRKRCPRTPGVYGMVDGQGELIYVGMSSHLQDRLLTYFTKGPPEAKEQRVAARARRLMWEVGDHELTVRLRELELICRWRPRFNSVGRPGRREIGFVYLTSTDAPNFRFGRQPPRSYCRCWGPLPLTRQTRAAVKRLNHLFLLRDCPDRTPVHFVEQLSMLPDDSHPNCLRGDVGTCLAPCSGERSRATYLQSIGQACLFLDGHDRSLIDRFETAMHQAASGRRYEQAAGHRDAWQSFAALWEQLELVRDGGAGHAGVHLLHGCSGKVWWALVAGGRVASVLRQPGSRRAARHCSQLIESTFSRANEAQPEDYEQMRIIVSWYREHPEQLSAVMDAGQAQRICADYSPSDCPDGDLAGVNVNETELMQ